jgi:hypothetical protein
MTKRKRTKGQTMIYKTLNRKLKNTTKNQGWVYTSTENDTGIIFKNSASVNYN